ncbi:transcriptional regulator, XRE family [Desulfofarcimen acetoxidans DSM 771]|uniref:Transcriptional regulator, XRE family n=1 Tax=Desulfofarcimen acetoxidans (strain ATCC 49208 / DSM 771 / KCTC 5769 / VKM B-1644 / 5575) TaxID=485916 RepID=C8W0I4_DESAS|nr:helix-turn-helix transcriptional regulator [Desulfofarcimen acetoxidans]ACV63239.1 transcriptional regulator, XRE family [Desulfofarcimen acetoxidans DSM 771]
MSLKNIFAKRLSLLIKENKASKQAVANAINISRPAISQFASGENLPSAEKLVALADFFGVSIDYLVGRSDDPRIPNALSNTICDFFADDSAPEMPPEVRQIVNKVIKLPHEKIKILNDVLDTWVESD